MSEKTEIQTLLDELKAMKESMGAATQQPQSGGILTGWQTQQPATLQGLEVEKVLIPIELVTQKGNVTVYYQLSGEIAKTPQSLIGVVVAMQNANIPVKSWQPKGGGNSWKQ